MKTLMVAWAALTLAAAGVVAAEYGSKERFIAGKPLVYPDGELEFLGMRKVASPVFPRGFIYWDFRMTCGKTIVPISWSSGTGEVGPLIFSCGRQKFVLELKASRAVKGWMKDDELVLWREKEYRTASR